MSGKIEYEGPNPDPQQFLGFLRLKKDPKVEKLTFTNFIARGSVLKNTEWYKTNNKLVFKFIF